MKKRCFVFLIFLLFLLSSCARADRYETRNFYVMDTLAEIRIYETVGSAVNAFAECKNLAENLEKEISATISGSETDRFNHNESGDFSEDFVQLVALSVTLSQKTGGAFDATCGSLIDLWNVCTAENRLPTAEEEKTALSVVGYEKICVSENTVTKTGLPILNFGAIGKGYAADRMAQNMKENGVLCGMISFVSSVTVFGDRTFTIGVRDSNPKNGLCGTVTLRNESLSVSGNYERFYEIGGKRYCHILNPMTGEPVEGDFHSVAVVCESGAVADALSTAIFVMGIEGATELYRSGEIAFEFLCFTGDKVVVSDGLLDRFVPETDSVTLVSLSSLIMEN